MTAVRIRDLIEAGAHFGHPVSRWHPKMEPYIYGKRNTIHIIDLRQTVRGILRAQHFLRSITAEGGKVLFIGTKRQAKTTISALALEVGMPFVSERWPGGMLTNFQTVRSRLKRLEELETLEAEGTISRYSKKMISSMRREKRKILRNLDGVRTMTELPAAILVVDPRHELIAVKESKTLDIPTVAVIDTDCNPELVDIPVPANDDAFRSVQIILASLAGAIGEGAAAWQEKLAVARKLEEQQEEAARKIKEARELARRQAQAAKAEKASKPAAPAKPEKPEPPKEPTSGEGADKSAQPGQPAASAGESTAPGSS